MLKRLRENGNGRGLPSLYRSVSQLNKDFGTLVEMLDAWYQDSNPSVEMSALNRKVRRIEARLASLSPQNINQTSRDEGVDDAEERLAGSE